MAFVNNTYIPGEDVLGFSPNPQNGISGTFNALTGILNLTGVASLANYQAALDSVTYFVGSTNPNQGGTAPARTLTFSVNDGAATDGVGTAIWTINVIPVNVAPTLGPIKNPPAVLESNVEQLITVPLSGITDGNGNTSLTLFVQAVTDNPGLIDPDSLGTLGPPSYTSPNTTGSLTFGVLPGASGVATITVTVSDNGSTANGGQITSLPQSFTVTVIPINAPPTINPITPSIIQFNENTLTTQTVQLTGISSGMGAPQVLNVTAISSNPQLIPTPSVTYPFTNPTTGNIDTTTGFLTFAAQPNLSGTAVITVTVTDNGGTSNGGVNTASQQFTVVVNPVNQPPTLSPIANPAAILENAGTQSLVISGISSGLGDPVQHLTVTAVSGNVGLIPTVTVTPATSFPETLTTAALSYTPTANASGSAVITVTVTDDGGLSVQRSFTVTVTPVNQQPQINAIPNPAPINEGTLGPLTINLSGISAGLGDQPQVLTLTATSSNTTLIPTPTLFYTSPDTTGLLEYNPAANASGTATITVTVTDNGGTANGGVNAISRSFLIVVNPVNQAPTLNAIANPATVLENTTTGTPVIINLAGISAGPGDAGLSLNVTATSSNPSLVPNPTIAYTSPSATGTLTYTPASFASGSAVITVYVTDNGSTANGGITQFQQQFTVTVTQISQPPTIDNIANPPAVLENTITPQEVDLTGIGPGLGDSGLLVNVFATSNNTSLISNPSVLYPTSSTGGVSSGRLFYTVAPNMSGTATITVVVQDNGSTANGGVNTTTTTFTVTVDPVDVPPTLNFISNPSPIGVNAGQQTINLAGITPGQGEAGQTVTITATSNNPSLIPNPSVSYTNPKTTGTLTYTPVPNSTGTAVITVTLINTGNTTFGGSNEYQQSFTVAVAPAHVAPVITTTPGNDAFTQGEDPILIDQGLNITSNNSPTIASVTVQIIGNYNPGEDVLAWTDPTGGLVTDSTGFNSATGTLTLTAVTPDTVTPAIFAEAAEAVTYQDINPNTPSTLTRTVEFTVDDGAASNNTDSAVKMITVSQVNLPPQINPISPPAITIFENFPVVTIPLSGISAGGGQIQTLKITATSNNTVLIPNPTVTYTSPNQNGNITFQPTPFMSGQATITVTVTDNLGDVTTDTLVVTVAPIDQAPTLNAIANPASFTEFAPSLTTIPPLPAPISLTNITAGTGDSQNLIVTAVVESSGTGVGQAPNTNPAIIASLSTTPVTITNPDGSTTILNELTGYSPNNTTGTLNYTLAPLQSGTAVIAVTVTDDGSTANGGVNTFTQTFTVTVLPVDQAPTISPIQSPPAVLENTTALQTVSLSGITDGVGDSNQFLTVKATSNNTALISTPSDTYTSPNTTGAITYSILPNVSGTAVITVVVMDDGSTANGGINTTTATFTVTVTAVNQQPTINAINNVTIVENASGQTVNFSGVTAGPGDIGQSLAVTATSNNPSLIPNTGTGALSVSYSSANPTGSLSFTPVFGATGTATITVTVTDSGATGAPNINSINEQFTVTVTPINAPPTLNVIPSPGSIPENAGAQTVLISGITSGASASQILTVTAASNNPGLIANPSVTYNSPDTTGYITYTPTANVSGTATITVTVMDNGGTASGGQNTVSQTFMVTVTQVNQPPTLDPIKNPAALALNAGQQTINLTGISAGAGDTGQTLTVTATSDNTSLILDPIVNATATATISGGTVNAINISNGGSGYMFPPVVTLTGGNFTTAATATATVINGVVTAITVSGGSGYTGVPLVSIAPPVSNATATATISGGTISPNGFTITNGGSGYLSPPVITVTGGGFATTPPVFTVGLTNGVVTSITATGGSGYTSVPTISIASPGTGVGALVVNYVPGAATGSITYTPVAGASGTADISVTVTDNGSVASGGPLSITRTFTVAVAPANPGPVVTTTAANLAYVQGAAATTIDPGVTVTDAGSSNILGAKIIIVNNFVAGQDILAFSPNPQNGISGSYNAATGELDLIGIATPALYQAALRSITYFNNSTSPSTLNRVVEFEVDDGGSINNIGLNFRTITVTAVNVAPTLNPITSPAPLFESATPAQQTIDLGGITAGAGAQQTLTVTATSNNTGLIPNPAVSYISPSTTGALTYTPAANASGTATITVLVTDSGGTANGGVNTTTQTFTVSVLPVNQAPTLTAIANPAAILENAGPQAITLTGIGSGSGNPTENLTIGVVSSNPNLIPNSGPGAVAISYTSPGTSAVLSYTPVPFTSGTAAIIVTVMNDGGVANSGFNLISRSFTVVVTPVNQQPTLAAIPSPAPILENALTAQNPGLITLTGIGPGQGDNAQILTITAVSSNTALIPNPSVSYTNFDGQGNRITTANLTYIPTTDASGSAVITVTATDNGGVANGGVNTISQQFTVTILPVNQPPTINLIPNPTPILENNTAVQTINLTGISAGRGNSGETVTITATSSNPALIPNPSPTPATATATLAGGTVNAIQVTNGGSDYAFPPVVTLTGASFVTPANVTAVVSGGVVTSIVVTGGSGYTSVPTVNIAPPTATATATAALIGSTVGSFTITSGGSGYTSPPAVFLSGGGFTTPAIATAEVTNGVVTAINFTGGVGYTSAPTVTIAAPATGSLTVNYVYPNTTGTLTYSVPPDTYGTTNITLTVMNSGTTANGGQVETVQTFPINVTHVNQAPDLLPIPNSPILLVSSPEQAVPLVGIDAGPGDLTFNPDLLTATAKATVSGGVVNTITVTGSGAGYTSSRQSTNGHARGRRLRREVRTRNGHRRGEQQRPGHRDPDHQSRLGLHHRPGRHDLVPAAGAVPQGHRHHQQHEPDHQRARRLHQSQHDRHAVL